MSNSVAEAKLCGNLDVCVSPPLSEFAKKLESRARQRYLEKMSAIGIDPVLIESKNFEPDCLAPVESTVFLFYLVLETSFYAQQQFKAFRRLEAYNQMFSGFRTNAKSHIIANKFVGLDKVRHSQRMNDSLIPICHQTFAQLTDSDLSIISKAFWNNRGQNSLEERGGIRFYLPLPGESVRTVVRACATSWLHCLPNFLTHCAPLRALRALRVRESSTTM